MKLAIYVHYDKMGDVQDYVLKCLNGLLTVVDQILVVVNGDLSNEGRAILRTIRGIEILRRPNSGFDFHAWKYALEHMEYKLEKYNSILLTNNTYYGPIYPFNEMWNQMEQIDCDFWGISKHPFIDCNFIAGDPNTKVIEHIQSYWIVFKNSILRQQLFKEFWLNIPDMPDFQTAVGYGEIALTKFFEEHGFRSASFLDVQKYSSILNSNPCLLTDTLVIEDRCPVAKRKFFYDYDDAYPQNEIPYSYRAKRLFDFLKNNHLYDTDAILKDLMNIVPIAQISQKLFMKCIPYNGSSVIESESTNNLEQAQQRFNNTFFKKHVIIFKINNIKFFMHTIERLKQLIKKCKVLLLIDDESVKLKVQAKIASEFSVQCQRNVQVITSLREIICLIKNKYDYAGFCSIELFGKDINNYKNSVEYDWCMDSFCGHGEKLDFVNNIFCNNKFIGMLKVTKPIANNTCRNFADVFWTRTNLYIEILNESLCYESVINKLLVKQNYLSTSYLEEYQLQFFDRSLQHACLNNSKHSKLHDIIVNSKNLKKCIQRIVFYRLLVGLRIVSKISYIKKMYKYAKRIFLIIKV